VRFVDWYLGLELGQKIVVGVAAAALLFVGTYLAGIILAVAVAMRADPPPQGQPQALASPSASSSASASSAPIATLKIDRARWEGDKAVVEGTWRGDLSSVHCDLLEGGKAGRAIDWWDRSVAAEMAFPEKTFSQEFVRAKGSDVKDRIDTKGEYGAVCRAQFSEGWSTGDEAPMEGRPPG
jgi:hypothetical protein